MGQPPDTDFLGVPKGDGAVWRSRGLVVPKDVCNELSIKWNVGECCMRI